MDCKFGSRAVAPGRLAHSANRHGSTAARSQFLQMQWHNFIASWKIVNDSRPVGGYSEGKEKWTCWNGDAAYWSAESTTEKI